LHIIFTFTVPIRPPAIAGSPLANLLPNAVSGVRGGGWENDCQNHPAQCGTMKTYQHSNAPGAFDFANGEV